MTTRAFLSALPLFAAVCAGSLSAQTALIKETPFVAAGAPAADVQAETIEFAGVSTVGKKTDLIFFDKSAKKHRWVPLGQTVEGISALNYDERLDQAVVKINGVQKTLPLRKGGSPANAPAPVAAMPAGFNIPPAVAPTPVVSLPAPASAQPVAAPPGSTQPAMVAAPAAAAPAGQDPQARQETEARMLVSDLLEIGMAQRKAYEDAQRKAQGADQSSPSTPAPANAALPAMPPQTAPAQPPPPQPAPSGR